MTRAAVWLIGAPLVLVLAPGCAPTRIAPDVPLQDRSVEPPDPDIPKALAAFSGRWVGVWTDGPGYSKNMALIIQQLIPPDRAIGFYGCGHQYPTPFPFCPGSTAVSGQLDGDTLKIDYPAVPAEGRFRINGQFLEGELVSSNTRRVLIRVRATRLP
jgi:hypothetical protein